MPFCSYLRAIRVEKDIRIVRIQTEFNDLRVGAVKTIPLPSQVTLQDLLRYDPSSGHLYWLARDPISFAGKGRSKEHEAALWNAKNAGKRAFSYQKHGYNQGRIFGIRYNANRIIWRLVTGEEPGELVVDHRNGNPMDDRFSNLRVLTQQDNTKGRFKSQAARNPIMGISRKGAGWCSYIRFGGKQHSKTFRCFGAAVMDRKRSEMENGFSERHGRRRNG